MDPDANLEEQLRLARSIVDGENNIDPDRLAELVLALDAWIRCGGFLPKAYSKKNEQKRNP